MPPHLAVRLARVGLGGLLVLAVAYGVTRTHAPGIRVRWRDNLSAARQAELEVKYLLTNGRAPMENAPRSLAYDLLDVSRSNIRALEKAPDVADTNDIDRDAFRVSPRAAPGERWTWLAYRLPVLRGAAGLWSLVSLLSVLAIVGLFGVAIEHRRFAALRGPEALDDRDLFDHLASFIPDLSPQHEDVRSFTARRVCAAVLVLVAVGAPLLETWEALLFGLALLTLIFGAGRPEPKRFGAAALLVLVVVGLKAVLPHADIAEAHNAFLVMRANEPLEKGIPPSIFRNWKAQFDAIYPAETEPYPLFSWRSFETVPKTLFSASSDAIWQKPKFTRQVDAIGFHSLAEFRGGFANDTQFNFWSGQLTRPALPFYVMYEMTSASVGSAFAWNGQVFWERGDGFEEVLHKSVSSRIIRPEDVGRRVYAAFFPQRDSHGNFEFRPYFELWPSPTLRLAGWLKTLLTLIGSLGVLALTVRPRWPGYLRAVSIAALSYAVMMWIVLRRGAPFLGHGYPPHGGGGDGLQHEGWGRMMALLAGHGNVVEALKGGEVVYWFTPGMRYFRMVEKLVFGDTNHLYALLLACVPLVVFLLMRHLLGARLALVATAVFVFMPVGNFSFFQFVDNARSGYAEAPGEMFFLLGLALLLGMPPGVTGASRNLPRLWTSGALLAVSMFLRPNFSLAVVGLGAVYALGACRCRDWRALAALACGLGLALWMPFHNWFYGREFFLISKSGATLSVPLGPRDYVTAIVDAVLGHFDTAAVTATSMQLKGWLGGPGFLEIYRDTLLPLAWALHGAKVFGLLLSGWLAATWLMTLGRRGDRDLALVAVATVMAHVPMLFIFDTNYRYAMLGWDLSLVVLVVWIVRVITAHDVRRHEMAETVRGPMGVLQPQ